jgi:hypothetical protein
MPKSVLDPYAERSRLSVHKLIGKFRSVRMLFIWRGDSPRQNGSD